MEYQEITELLIKNGFRTKNKAHVKLDEDDQFRLQVLAEEIVGYSLDPQDFVDYGYASTDDSSVTLDYSEQCDLNDYIHRMQYPEED